MLEFGCPKATYLGYVRGEDWFLFYCVWLVPAKMAQSAAGAGGKLRCGCAYLVGTRGKGGTNDESLQS